jgi:hypothetical protein
VIVIEDANTLSNVRRYVFREKIGNPVNIFLDVGRRVREGIVRRKVCRIFLRPPGGVRVRSETMHEDDAAAEAHIRNIPQMWARQNLTLTR